MRYSTKKSFVAVATVIATLVGCYLKVVRENWKGDQSPTSDQKPLLPASKASAEVSRMLYERNLISNPEVNRRMNQTVLQISRDGAAPDSVMPVFFHWLENWASTHPTEVEAARLVGGAYTLEARAVYVDTDSSRNAQTDSIRRLVRERARRRSEQAEIVPKSARLD